MAIISYHHPPTTFVPSVTVRALAQLCPLPALRGRAGGQHQRPHWGRGGPQSGGEIQLRRVSHTEPAQS